MKKTNKKVILAIILISYFMILLDNSIIFTGTVDCKINPNAVRTKKISFL
ncbi:hypothetical protein [Latilactobacillus sakei]|nr:hypothetical protein [Latilactobacillus sakei]